MPLAKPVTIKMCFSAH